MKRWNGHFVLGMVVAACLVGSLIFTGCEEEDTPVIQDSEVLESYIYNSEDGRDLFRTDNLFADDEYTIPFDSATFKTIVDSIQRSIDLDIFVDSARYDSIRNSRSGYERTC